MGIYENARNITKNRIIENFWALYKKEPIEKVTVIEVAKASGIGRGTFYHHFQDVYAVLEEIEAKLSFSLHNMALEVRKGLEGENKSTSARGIKRGPESSSGNGFKSISEKSPVNGSLRGGSEERPGSGTASLNLLNRVLYASYGDEKTKDYVNVLILEHRDPFFAKEYLNKLEELVREVCVEDQNAVYSEKDRMIVDGAITAVTDLLLNCICRATLSIEETDELILGLMQNGFYITLTNRFGIHALKNPFGFSPRSDSSSEPVEEVRAMEHTAPADPGDHGVDPRE